MKRLLALSAILIPIYLFSQGFGSFSRDQPFLASSSVSATGPYSLSNDAALTFWLDPHTLANGNLTVWRDKIRGDGFIPDGAPPMSYDSGNQWVDNTGKFGSSVTNVYGSGTGFSLLTNTVPTFAYGIIIRCEPGVSANRKGMWNSSNYTAAANGVVNSGDPASMYYPFQSPRVIIDIPLNIWFDLFILHSKPTPDLSTMTNYIFTNGVFAEFNTTTAIWTNAGVHPFVQFGASSGQQNGFAGQWRDIVVWTNITLANMTNYATNLHFYRTNTYAP